MLDKFTTHLRQAQAKVTLPRLKVFSFLQVHDPTTTRAVIEAMSPTMDRASVYRTLGLFRELDIIHDIVAGGHRMIELTDRFDSHHHHLSCLQCGKHESVADIQIEQRLTAIAQQHGFRMLAHQIQISGLCQNCSKAASTPPAEGRTQ